MAAAASVAAGWADEEFTDGELEVAAILCDLPAIERARRRRRRPEIPTWGRRRPRTLPVEKPAAVAVADRGEGAASPDTPLAFPEESGGDDGEAAAAKKKSRTHEQWVQEQRGVVANLSQENTHLLKQIEEYRARLQSSRSTNDSLKQMQSKLKQQRQQEEEQRKRKLQAEATAVDRPALGLDLNEPAEEAKAQAAAAAAAAEWYHRGQQRAMVYKAAAAAAARRLRREIRRAKVSSSAAAGRIKTR